MGNLTQILRGEPQWEVEELTSQLGSCFGAWERYLLGQQQSLQYHCFNDLFFKVENLVFQEQGTLSALLQDVQEFCNIIIS